LFFSLFHPSAERRQAGMAHFCSTFLLFLVVPVFLLLVNFSPSPIRANPNVEEIVHHSVAVGEDIENIEKSGGTVNKEQAKSLAVNFAKVIDSTLRFIPVIGDLFAKHSSSRTRRHIAGNSTHLLATLLVKHRALTALGQLEAILAGFGGLFIVVNAKNKK
jgi:hypothetical protein